MLSADCKIYFSNENKTKKINKIKKAVICVYSSAVFFYKSIKRKAMVSIITFFYTLFAHEYILKVLCGGSTEADRMRWQIVQMKVILIILYECNTCSLMLFLFFYFVYDEAEENK